MRWKNPSLVLMIGLMQFAIFLLVAEFLYPGYSNSQNYISDLGVGPEPSRAVFTVSVIIFGALALIAGYLYRSVPKYRWFGVMMIIGGVGGIGVGLFNEDTGSAHVLFSFIAFFFSAIAAMLSSKTQKVPLSVFSVVLGTMSLAALVLLATNEYLGLGVGGMERMIFYPILLWGLVFAGSTLAEFETEDRAPMN